MLIRIKLCGRIIGPAHYFYVIMLIHDLFGNSTSYKVEEPAVFHCKIQAALTKQSLAGLRYVTSAGYTVPVYVDMNSVCRVINKSRTVSCPRAHLVD